MTLGDVEKASCSYDDVDSGRGSEYVTPQMSPFQPIKNRREHTVGHHHERSFQSSVCLTLFQQVSLQHETSFIRRSPTMTMQVASLSSKVHLQPDETEDATAAAGKHKKKDKKKKKKGEKKDKKKRKKRKKGEQKDEEYATEDIADIVNV